MRVNWATYEIAMSSWKKVACNWLLNYSLARVIKVWIYAVSVKITDIVLSCSAVSWWSYTPFLQSFQESGQKKKTLVLISNTELCHCPAVNTSSSLESNKTSFCQTAMRTAHLNMGLVLQQ